MVSTTALCWHPPAFFSSTHVCAYKMARSTPFFYICTPSFFRNHLDNGITPEHDDPIPTSPEHHSPESDTTASSYLDSYQLEPYSHNLILPAESAEARKMPPTNGYTSKVRVLDRYKVVGFISSGTYGRVYKAVGHNGMAGEFAIKKFVLCSLPRAQIIDRNVT